jgi:hypothetical protein
MEIMMSVRTPGRFGSLRTAAFAALALGAVAAQPSLAQDRTLATLADVPALVPAPHHPQAITAVYSSSLFDQSGGTHFWH